MIQVLKQFYQVLKKLKVRSGVILPSLDTLLMITFLKIIQEKNLKLLNPKANQKELEKHWSKLYDDFWKQKNDGLSKLILRKENEILIKKTKLSILYTVYNALLSLSALEITEQTIIQKQKLIDLYEKQTKNKINIFLSYFDLLEKIKSSINNFENIIQKLEKEITQKTSDEIINGFDVIANVSSNFPFQLNPQTLVVSEYISYEKLAKKNIKTNGTK